jgi:hypothetical protein
MKSANSALLPFVIECLIEMPKYRPNGLDRLANRLQPVAQRLEVSDRCESCQAA